MARDRRCGGCGHEELAPSSGTVSVELARCGVVATASVPARTCPRCGRVHVAPAALARAQLAVGCALADHGVQTGDAFRQLRKALALRAAELARLLGVTPETISHWETGRATPARGAFVALAAMAEEAIRGRSTTRDRLAALADARPWPRTLAVEVSSRARR